MNVNWILPGLILLTVACAMLPVPVMAADENPFATYSRPDAARYRACVAKTASEPDVAREAATVWLDNEGGVPAKHCLALALINLDRYAEGAQWLQEGARDVGENRGLDAMGAKGGFEMQVGMLVQAGHAWTMAKEHARAIDAFSEAIAATPAGQDHLRAELYRERGLVEAARGEWGNVVANMGEAIALDADEPSYYVLRATANRRKGEYDDASRDLARALARDKDHVGALLERGNLRRTEGDDAGARRDWERVVELYPGTEDAELALDNIELMRAD